MVTNEMKSPEAVIVCMQGRSITDARVSKRLLSRTPIMHHSKRLHDAACADPKRLHRATNSHVTSYLAGLVTVA